MLAMTLHTVKKRRRSEVLIGEFHCQNHYAGAGMMRVRGAGLGLRTLWFVGRRCRRVAARRL